MQINIPHPNGNRAAQMANIKGQIAQAAAINNAMKAGSASNQPTQPLPGTANPPTATTQRPPTKQANTLTSPTLVTPPNQSGFNYPGGTAPPPPASSQNAAQKAADLQRRSIESSRQLLNALKMNASRANQGLANIPTPGDIWVPFWILIFIFFILIPVGGHPRLAWLWLVIIGHAEISGEVIQVPQYGNGGSTGIIQSIIGAVGGASTSSSENSGPSNSSGNSNSSSSSTSNKPNWGISLPPANGGLNIIPYLETANLGAEGM